MQKYVNAWHFLYTDNQSENKQNILDSTICVCKMMKLAETPPDTPHKWHHR